MFAIEMKHITKQFGSLKANDDVSLSVESGKIHALVGENGAGKSTLMNILYGMYEPDSGNIFVNGKKEIINSPAKAISLGIGMVHQHFMLFPPLTVTENIILGKEPVSNIRLLDLKQAEDIVQKLSDTYSLKVDPKTKIESLSVGMQQRVEILKVLYRNANILILDEPTPVLTPQEIEDLFRTLKNLTRQGKTVIIITHKLSEVMNISDSVTILRRGKSISTVKTNETNKEELAKWMVGQEIESQIVKAKISNRLPGLVVENLSAHNNKNLVALHNVSFSISKGEILGIAAVEGNGQSELVEVLCGLRKKTSGIIMVDKTELKFPINNDVISHIPEDRLKRGLVLGFSLNENLILGRQREGIFYTNIFLSKTKIESHADHLISQFDIRPQEKKRNIRNFSGGNQQKAVIARELSKNTPVIVASHPTRGLDISATKFVHDSLLAERNNGKAILLVASDLEELLQISDRIAIMYEGEIVAILHSQETSERELGLYMTGSKRKTV